MLHAIFRHYNHNDNVVEINVEDPAPAFVQLRNMVDYERFVQSHRTWFQCIDDNNNNNNNHNDVSDPNFFTPLKESQAVEISKLSKTTTQQVHIVYELDKLQQLQDFLQQQQDGHAPVVVGGNDDLIFTRFRLLVKSRLNKHHREEIGACNDKTLAKALLAQFFDQVHDQYRTILHAVAKRQRAALEPTDLSTSNTTSINTMPTTQHKKEDIRPRSVASGTLGEIASKTKWQGAPLQH
jgi:hypothetical protein